MDFASFDDDAAEEHELCFDGPEPEAAAPEARPARKRGGRKAAPPPEPVAEPVEAPPPANDPAPACAPFSPPPVAKPSRLPTVAVGLAAVAALFSAIGLLVTARNLSVLAVARTEVHEREQALARLPHLLEEMETLTARQRAELDRLVNRRQGEPITRAELAAQLDGLRYALSRMQAPGTAALAGVMREGQAELADRIDAIVDRLEAVETRGPRKPAAH